MTRLGRSALFAAALLWAALLAACGGEKKLSGEMVEFSSEGDAGLASFVLETDRGERIGILVSEETTLWSLVDGVDSQDFRANPRPRSAVSVTCGGPRRSLTDGAGVRLAAYPAEMVKVEGILTPSAAALSDGTELDRMDAWRSARYRLPEGVELLLVDGPSGPEGVYVAGLPGFDDLSEAAQERVRSYYRDQGPLYDLQAELERAWAAYRAAPADFSAHTTGQEVHPTGANRHVMYFCTAVTLPVSGGVCYERRLGAAFDRETGAPIDTWDLFTCPPEQAKEALLELAEPQDPAARREMAAALGPENLIFSSDGLELWFPQGSLPSQGTSCGFFLDYDGTLAGILQSWALPDSREP